MPDNFSRVWKFFAGFFQGLEKRGNGLRAAGVSCYLQRRMSAEFQIDGRTRAFAVLGHPVAHTLSPPMHNAAFRALGWNAVYLAFDVAPEHVPEALRGMAALGFGGVNVTVPLKEVACRAMTRLDESAQLVGSVNTVQFTSDGLVGHSTDGHGFLRAFAEAFGVGVEGRSIFLLGAGGAGRALALVCAREGAARIVLADIEGDRAERVRAEAVALNLGDVVRTSADAGRWPAEAREAEVVIQATPVGMKPGDPSPLPVEAFRAGQLVFDLIYTPPETPLLRLARAAGARGVNGLGMLLYQGVRSFHIWTGVEPPADVMRKALERAVYGS